MSETGLTVAEVVATIACPTCMAGKGCGCWWFYGYDASAAHPERWAVYQLHRTERQKLAEWNAMVSPSGGAAPERTREGHT